MSISHFRKAVNVRALIFYLSVQGTVKLYFSSYPITRSICSTSTRSINIFISLRWFDALCFRILSGFLLSFLCEFIWPVTANVQSVSSAVVTPISSCTFNSSRILLPCKYRQTDRQTDRILFWERDRNQLTTQYMQ